MTRRSSLTHARRNSSTWGLALGVTLLVTGHVSAQGRGAPSALNLVRLAGAESCPDLRALSRQVDAHLGRGAFVSPSDAEVLFDVVLTVGERGGWSAMIVASTVSGEQLGQRQLLLPQPNCAEASDAVALALALMIEPNLVGAEPAPTPVPRSAPSVGPAPPPDSAPKASAPVGVTAPAVSRTSPRASRVSPPAPRPWRTRVAVGALGTLGQVPQAAEGLFVGARFAPPHGSLSFELGASLVAAKRAELRDGAGGDISATLGEALAHWSIAESSGAAIAVSPKLQVGRMSAVGSGFSGTSRAASALLLNVGIALEAAVALNRNFSLLVRPSLVFPLFRESFEATRSDGRTETIFQPAAAIAGASLGIGFQP
ncbi:MAG TPA: hypothetical protein VFQ61_20645 [Polyangiaceae bacterium]|nr:hypothetical protein [Polyangiaceae bacterium]